MKKILYSLIMVIVFLLIPNLVSATNEVDLYLFHWSECSHCKSEIAFLEDIEDKYPNLNVHMYEVTEGNNSKIMSDLKKITGETGDGVPFTMIGTKHFLGYNEDVRDKIEAYINAYSETEHNDTAGIYFGTKEKIDVLDIDEINEEVAAKKDFVKVPIFGEINLKKTPLAMLAVIIGTIDGFNPCAMWVLLFLITMLIGMNDRKRMWIIGSAFLLTSTLVYAFFMVAWLKVAELFLVNKFLKLGIGVFALGGAYLNLKSYLKSLKKDDGCEVVSKTKRQEIFEKIRTFTHQKSLLIAVIGAIALAVSVNFIELACSAGLPVIFTSTLAANDLSSIEYSIYIGIYLLFFLIDDLIIFTIAMATMKVTGISNKYSKYSHLIGGLIMLIFGYLLIFFPELLSFNI